jgi:hypothetical protein
MTLIGVGSFWASRSEQYKETSAEGKGVYVDK